MPTKPSRWAQPTLPMLSPQDFARLLQDKLIDAGEQRAVEFRADLFGFVPRGGDLSSIFPLDNYYRLYLSAPSDGERQRVIRQFTSDWLRHAKAASPVAPGAGGAPAGYARSPLANPGPSAPFIPNPLAAGPPHLGRRAIRRRRRGNRRRLRIAGAGRHCWISWDRVRLLLRHAVGDDGTRQEPDGQNGPRPRSSLGTRMGLSAAGRRAADGNARRATAAVRGITTTPIAGRSLAWRFPRASGLASRP